MSASIDKTRESFDQPRVLGIPVTPLTRRRVDNFKANRRGWWSLWLFSILFVASMCAELIANDKPLLLQYKGELYTPFLVTYTETQFGGDFETEADYRDEFVAELIEQEGEGWMIWPPIRYSWDTVNRDTRYDDNGRPISFPWSPSAENWLGTDDQGRDVVARLIYGFRLSVLFGFSLTVLSSIIGIAAGAVQGYFGGWVDLIGQRFIEIWSGMPVLYLLIIMAAVITPGFWSLLVLMLLFSWMSLVGVVRAEFLRARNFDYVRAARSLGVGDFTIMWRHVLPNAMVATVTFMPFILTGSVTTLTSLDFLGFGLPPGSPSLGELLKQGKENLQAPWLGLTAFFSLAIMLSLLTFVGEAVRDAFDPRKLITSGKQAEDAAEEVAEAETQEAKS
ncbi:MAG: ABC transporter permease [Alphaproteobacteria bacterium]